MNIKMDGTAAVALVLIAFFVSMGVSETAKNLRANSCPATQTEGNPS